MKRTILLAVMLFIVVFIPGVVSADFSVNSVQIDPSGTIQAGNTVDTSFAIHPYSGSTTNTLQLYTQLENPNWSYIINVNGVPTGSTGSSAQTVTISSFLLSYKSGDDVSVTVTLRGTAPSGIEMTSLTLFRITEIDGSGYSIDSSKYVKMADYKPSVGTITLSSVPAGANIYIDNSYKGLTPLSVSDISNGNRTILLKSDGYQDWTKIVFVNGDSQTVSATLITVNATTAVTTATTTAPKVNGTLYVQSSPSGASIYVDSTYLGKTTTTLYNITPGSHAIHLLLSGYNDWSDTITVTSGNTTNEYAPLTETAADVTAATTSAPTTVKTSLKVTTVKVPTTYPRTTTTKASPVEGAVILGAIGLGIVAIHRKQ
jgi:hypothetical protein